MLKYFIQIRSGQNIENQSIRIELSEIFTHLRHDKYRDSKNTRLEALDAVFTEVEGGIRFAKTRALI